MTDRRAALADAWWESLDADRRCQIHRWITGRDPHDDLRPIAGQIDLLGLLTKER